MCAHTLVLLCELVQKCGYIFYTEVPMSKQIISGILTILVILATNEYGANSCHYVFLRPQRL